MPYAKPLPQPDPVTQPYWDSLKAHAMRLQRCRACAAYVFYPRAHCPACFGTDLEWVPASGRGTIHAFTIVYRHPQPEFQAEAPYVVALVELDEGVRLMTSLVDVVADPAHVAIGAPVEIVYDDVTPSITLPRFRLVRQRAAQPPAVATRPRRV